eukprot:752180-Pyramimonas_sp.AAC.1
MRFACLKPSLPGLSGSRWPGFTSRLFGWPSLMACTKRAGTLKILDLSTFAASSGRTTLTASCS